MKKIVVIFLVFLFVPLFACSSAIDVNGDKMINLNTFQVHIKGGEIHSIDTTIISSNQDIVDFLNNNNDRFIWHSDIQPSINVFAEFLLNNYDDSFFKTNNLVLYGALKDINNGIYYNIRDYQFENNNLNINVDRLNPGGGRVIVYNMLIFEVSVDQNKLESVNITVSDL